MDQNLTNALTRVAGILAAVLVLWGVHQAVQTFYLVNPQAQAPEQASFDVTGNGRAVVAPDIAKLTLSVVNQGDTSEAVTTAGNETMASVVASLKTAGIEAADIKTTGYNLSPRYDYSRKNSGEINGYELNQSVTVTIRDLDKVASIMDAAQSAGANSVSTPSFEVDDPEAAKAEARAEAFTKAKQRAESLADAAGVRLGDIISFSESSSDGSEPVSYYYAEKAMDTQATLGGNVIEAGSNEVDVTVSVKYAIIN